MNSSLHNPIPASLFDGQSTTAHAVRISVVNGELRVYGADGANRSVVAIDDIELSEPTRFGARFALLPDGATIEVHDANAFNDALGNAGHAPPIVARLQQQWPIAIAGLALLAVVGLFAYTVGIPAAARWTAFHVTMRIEKRLGDGVLEQLDTQAFGQSSLSMARQAELQSQFKRYARTAAPNVEAKLIFRRRGGMSGINAFALPGGTIVLLDGLVERSENDEQVLAVLGHELGHVAEKHAMRQLLQTIGVGMTAGALWGDFSSAVANASVVFGVLEYSREFELQADDFARDYLVKNGSSPEALASFFELIEEIQSRNGDVPAFLSTHPPTDERIARIRGAAPPR